MLGSKHTDCAVDIGRSHAVPFKLYAVFNVYIFARIDLQTHVFPDGAVLRLYRIQTAAVYQIGKMSFVYFVLIANDIAARVVDVIHFYAVGNHDIVGGIVQKREIIFITVKAHNIAAHAPTVVEPILRYKAVIGRSDGRIVSLGKVFQEYALFFPIHAYTVIEHLIHRVARKVLGRFGAVERCIFIFGIANDCLVDKYDVGDYRKVILPMIVIRRLDAVLEPTKKEVLKTKKVLESQGISDMDDVLAGVAKQSFSNSSPYTLKDLKSRTNKQQLKKDFTLYLNGFSKNVQDIIDKFGFRAQINTLCDYDLLGMLINKLTDSSINLSNRPVLDANGKVLSPDMTRPSDAATAGKLDELSK